MKLLDKKEISEWAYNQCKNGNNTPEIRNLITSDCWAYWYCKNIKDIEEMWSKIRESYWLWSYNIHIKKYEPEFGSKIKDKTLTTKTFGW